MRRLLAAACLTLAIGSTLAPAQTLTPAEQAAGWKLLLRGDDGSAWRGYRKEGFPEKGWEVSGGELRVLKGGGGGDLVTREQFGDFELSLEFKCEKAANSGIIYRVSEAKDATWQTGPEFQVLDDGGYGAKPGDSHTAGSLYDMIAAPADKALRPAGEWNHARVRMHQGLLQHFLNGRKIVECRTDGPAWKEMIAKSKFKEYAGFGIQPRGHIALQEHGDGVAYRNIKVRDLGGTLPGEVSLFAGKDLSQWTFLLPEGGKMEDVWSIDGEGVLVCKGNPVGYLRTKDSFTDYVLKLEWRFNPVTKKAGNSGVLLRVQEPDQVWPRSIEAQLMSGSAGDFWNIGNFVMTADAGRTNGRNTKHLRANEQPLGEWNEYEIIVDGGDVTLNVNGETLNAASNCERIPGTIALQSEGAEIHFRRVRLAPITGN
jgi:hypothetical protein